MLLSKRERVAKQIFTAFSLKECGDPCLEHFSKITRKTGWIRQFKESGRKIISNLYPEAPIDILRFNRHSQNENTNSDKCFIRFLSSPAPSRFLIYIFASYSKL
jgi:hypothetical protein